MAPAMDRSRWTTNPYYALVILIIACGSIPKGALFIQVCFFLYATKKTCTYD